MRELIQAGQQTYYIKGFTNAGIYRQGENEVYVIDLREPMKTRAGRLKRYCKAKGGSSRVSCAPTVIRTIREQMRIYRTNTDALYLHTAWRLYL